MIHKACMPVYMNSGKIVADGTGGRDGWRIKGSTSGPRGPKNFKPMLWRLVVIDICFWDSLPEQGQLLLESIFVD